MFFIIIVIFISVIFLIMIFHICRKLCHDEPVHPPAYRDPQSPAPPPLGPMPALPSLPGTGIPVGLEPPPYSEVGPAWPGGWAPGGYGGGGYGVGQWGGGTMG